jgi:hypothetical protein
VLPGNDVSSSILPALDQADIKRRGDSFSTRSTRQSHPQSRVWVLSLLPIPTEPEAVDALAGYEARNRFDAQGIFAELYVPKRASPEVTK